MATITDAPTRAIRSIVSGASSERKHSEESSISYPMLNVFR